MRMREMQVGMMRRGSTSGVRSSDEKYWQERAVPRTTRASGRGVDAEK
jgi:hypothetical protein